MRRYMRIGSVNCAGLTNTLPEIERHMNMADIDIMFVSETYLLPQSRLDSTDLLIARNDQPFLRLGARRAHGGLAVLLKRGLRDSAKVISKCPDQTFIAVETSDYRLVGIYWAPSLPDELFEKSLEAIEALLTGSTKPVILLGDLNSRFGEIVGDSAWNPRGRIVHAWMAAHDLIVPNRVSGAWSFEGFQGKSIPDHILVPEMIIPKVSRYHFRDWRADHAFIIADLEHARVHRPKEPQGLFPLKVNREALSDRATRLGLDIFLRQNDSVMVRRRGTILTGQELVDLQWNQTWLLLWAGLVHVGVVADRKHTGFRGIWDGELEQMAEARRRLFDRFRHRGRTAVDWAAYKVADKAVKHRVAWKKKRASDRIGKWLQSMKVGERHAAVSRLLKSWGRSSSSTLSLDQQGRCLADVGADHYRGKMREAAISHGSIPPFDEVRLADPFVGNSDAVSIPGLFSAIKVTAGRRAPGVDGLPAEVFKAGGYGVASLLECLSKSSLKQGCCPLEWSQGLVYPIYKGKGAEDDFCNRRPITVLPVVRKIFERVILPSIEAGVGDLSIFQGGFRKKRGTLDQCLVLDSLLARGGRCAAFLDIAQAYDGVCRPLLWRKCRDRGLNDSLLAVCMSLCDRGVSRVVIEDQVSEPYPVTCGVPQGSVLSPLLYSVFIDDLVQALTEAGPGLRLGQVDFHGALYADDIAAVAEDRDKLQRVLDKAAHHSLQNGYRFNVGKCAAFLPAGSEPLHLYDQALPCVGSFKYLGVELGHKGIENRSHLQTLAARGLKAIATCGRVLHHKHLSPLAKLGVYRAFIRPTMEYGLQLVKPLKSAMQALERVQNRALRSCLALPWNASISAMLGATAMPTLMQRATCLAIRFALSLRSKDASFLASHAGNSKTVRMLSKAVEDHPVMTAALSLPPRLRAQAMGPVYHQLWSSSRNGVVAERMEKPNWSPDAILSVEDRRVRYRLLGWRFCLTFGAPDLCSRCPETRCSWKHAVVCSGADELVRSASDCPEDAQDPISVGLNLLQLDPQLRTIVDQAIRLARSCLP